jgi:hypothetical protein
MGEVYSKKGYDGLFQLLPSPFVQGELDLEGHPQGLLLEGLPTLAGLKPLDKGLSPGAQAGFKEVHQLSAKLLGALHGEDEAPLQEVCQNQVGAFSQTAFPHHLFLGAPPIAEGVDPPLLGGGLPVALGGGGVAAEDHG